MSPHRQTLLTVGATGSIGQHVIEEALRQGYAVRALVRSPGSHRKWPPDVEVVVGELTRKDSLVQAVTGIDAVVFTHGAPYGDIQGAEAVDYGGVRNIILALKGSRKTRLALMTAIGVTDRREGHDWKRRGERLVRASGLPYTIVRPGWFDYNGPKQRRLVLLQGDRRQSGTPNDGVVSRRQIAQVLLESLRSPQALNKTVELVAEAGPETEDFDSLFATAVSDAPRALDGARDDANMPLDKEPARVTTDLQNVRTHAGETS